MGKAEVAQLPEFACIDGPDCEIVVSAVDFRQAINKLPAVIIVEGGRHGLERIGAKEVRETRGRPIEALGRRMEQGGVYHISVADPLEVTEAKYVRKERIVGCIFFCFVKNEYRFWVRGKYTRVIL